MYYAHLASKRAEAHIDMANTERVRIVKERMRTGREDRKRAEELAVQTEWPKLQPFEPKNQMGYGMWYI